MARFHPESPDVSLDALSRLQFVAEFRKQLHGLTRGNRAAYDAQRADLALPEEREERRAMVRQSLEAHPYFQGWSSMLRSSQDLMWRYTSQAVDADQSRMAARFEVVASASGGSLSLDPGLTADGYITDADIHRMPGGYTADQGGADLRAGALYDLGGAVYQMGLGNRTGGLLNDSRGHTLVAHLKSRFPDFKPRRILDLGCNVGHNTLPLAKAFPEAETFGLDVGAALLRYAHLRAEGLGQKVHFVQGDAERTSFDDASFDLVVSQIVLHETSVPAIPRIFAESRRLLRPGGVVAHLEVPIQAESGDDFQQVMALWEEFYNAEPNISGVMDADFKAIAQAAGFVDVEVGFQDIPDAKTGASEFRPDRIKERFSQWLVVSGRAGEALN